MGARPPTQDTSKGVGDPKPRQWSIAPQRVNNREKSPSTPERGNYTNYWAPLRKTRVTSLLRRRTRLRTALLRPPSDLRRSPPPSQNHYTIHFQPSCPPSVPPSLTQIEEVESDTCSEGSCSTCNSCNSGEGNSSDSPLLEPREILGVPTFGRAQSRWVSENYFVRTPYVSDILSRFRVLPEIDTFASKYDSRLPTWWGPGSPFEEDAFAQGWNGPLLWANPL